MGKASPQYRFFLLINQSLILISQSNSLSNPNSGRHSIILAVSFICSLRVLPVPFSFLSIAIYHSLVTRQTSSVLHLQQAGYLCVYCIVLRRYFPSSEVLRKSMI